MSEMKGLREKEKKELRKILGETRAEIARLLGERASGSKKDLSSSRKKRREVARILTVLQEKEILTHSTSLRVNPEFTEGLKQVAESKEPKMDGRITT